MFKNLKINILFVILFSLTSFELLADDKFWVAADCSVTNDFSNNANWSSTKDGPGGARRPNKNDVAIFGATADSSDCNAELTSRNVIQKLILKNNYDGTVSVANNQILTLRQNFSINGGTLFLGTDATLNASKSMSHIQDGGTLSSANALLVKIFPSLNIHEGGTFIAPAKNTLFLGGFINNGTFTHSNGTVTFSPRDSSYQVLTNGTGTGKDFYNVIKNNKNTTLRMNGDMQVNNITLNRGILNVDGNDLYVKGNYIANSSNRREVTNTSASTSVIFNGTGNQNVIAHNSGAWPSFENLTITNTTGVVSFSTKNVGIDKTLTINSGAILDISGLNMTATTLVNNGTLQLEGDETVTITNKDTNSGTITYDGSGTYNDLEYGDNYYNLTFNGTGTYTLDANLNVDGALTITDGTLDVSSDDRSINVAGNWTNSDIFKSRSGTVTFDGTSTITSGGITDQAQDFYNVILSGSAGTQSTNHVDVDNDFTISSSGTWNTSGLCLFVAGTTTTGSGTLTNTTLPTVTFDPANSDNDVQPTENITLTFNHAMRNTDDSALTNTNVDSLITLKVNNSSGADIAFDATIDSDKKVITINPDSNLTGQQNVYVAIGATVEDQTCGQAITAANATFTVVDTDVPTLTSSTPTDGATEVGVNDNIVFNFSKAVDAESGNIVIYKASDDSEVESIPVGNAKVSGSGSTQITINPASTLDSSTAYYVQIAATAFDDSSSNSYAGINDKTSLNFTTADVNAPTLSSSTPADGATGIAIDANIVLTFNEAVDAESGNIIIYKSSDDSQVESIPVGDAKVSGSGSTTITINPSTTLDGSTAYYIQVAATAFDDSSSNSYAGISDATTLNFTTADIGAPTLSSSTPADGATGIAVDANIVLTFNEAVDAESGNIIIYKTSDDSEVESIPIGNAKVSGSGSTEITVNPATTLDSFTSYYVKIEATAFDDSSSNSYVGITDTTTLNFTTADVEAPTLTFSPLDGTTGIADNTNITITFDEAIRNTDNSELTDSNIDSLITLKEDNSSGSNIDFDATIDSDKKIITINPDSDFSSEQVVYVAIGATVEDSSNNAISASNISFTVAAPTSPPSLTFNPSDNSTGNAVDTNITITFDKAIRHIDDTDIADTDIDSLITLRKTNSSGNRIPFNATIDNTKKVITINPSSNFSSSQVVYVEIGATVEDYYNNAISNSSITFTVADTVAPTITFSPTNGETDVTVSSNITLTFNEAIRNTNNTVLTDTNVDSLITLKNSDEDGDNISFNATINSDKKIITINPDSNFSSEQVVYVAIGTTVEDSSDNAITAQSITFTAADSTPPTVTFSPADSETGIAVNSDITIAFDEVVRNIDNTSLTDANVDSLITLKETNTNGSDISFTALIDSTKQLITITPDNSFSSEQVVYVAIGATVEDSSDNAISASSITFTAADATAPEVTFDPADTSTGVPITANVTLTFDEAVRNPDDSELTNSNVGNLITLEYVSDNASIDFTATIDSDKKIITINPDANFISGRFVRVEIQALEDSSNNTMSATSGTFSVTDSTAPVVTIDPADGSTLVALDTDVIITFNEEVRLLDNSAINNTNVDSLITLKDSNSTGTDIAFDATINSDKTIITIDLLSDISSEQTVYVAVGATVEDSYGNAIIATSSTFTAADKLPPSVEIEAVITASIAVNSDITFTFSEAIRNLNNTALINSDVASLMTLKDTDENGADIPFVATINSAKTIITIDPVSNFTSAQKIYAAIGATVEDFADNVIPASSKTFTAEFLKEDLENPFNEKDVIALIDAQRETSKRFIEQSSYAVLNRMEWLRRNRDVNNLSDQGIKIKFSDEEYTEIATALNFDKYINRTKDLFNNNWAFWSEGTVTLGEIDNTSLASLQEIQTTGITIGVDKKVSDRRMYGFALRVGLDDVDIGTSDTNLKTDMFSLSSYATFPFNNKTFIDTNIGISSLKIDSRRKHEAGFLNGNRNGNQIFGSIVYGGEFIKKDLNISPYGRIDLGYTILDEYLESGKISALKYNEMKIENSKSSLGFLINNSYEINNLKFKPFSRFEYGRGSTDSNDTIVSYHKAYPNTNYTNKGVNESSDNYRVTLGTDLDIGKNMFYTASFERNEEIDSGYTNTMNFAGSYLIKPNAELSFHSNLTNENTSQFSIQYDQQSKSGWDLNYNIELQNSFNVNSESNVGINVKKIF
ncbi:Ig-like domain-containing protein [Candidatus Pelagibacter bacterium nBUS_27]|uniref:Ig-like domain-containing protein n=1 Tax=Candidatus Pelagibacter bacterium nBUS_27 TaxID=3374188 RepID=UPI003EBC2DA3